MDRRQFMNVTAGLGLAASLGGVAPAALAAPATGGREGRRRRQERLLGQTLEQARDEMRMYLFDHYLPFWEFGGDDKELGGFMVNLDPEGRPVDAEKYIWYQGRGLWVYSFLYNNFGRDPRWLDVAKRARDFMVKHMHAGNGRWLDTVSREGAVINPVSPVIYTSLFPAEGLMEYAVATGRDEDMQLALTSIRAAVETYEQPDYAGANQPGQRPQGHSMIFIRVLEQLLRHHQEPWLEALADEHVHHLMDDFYNPEYRISNENLEHDYSRIPGQEAHMNIGHSVEIMWFVMDEALRRRDQAMFDWAADNFRRYIQMGWDYNFDGLGGEYRVFAGDGKVQGATFDSKVMWAHMEIMVGTMMLLEQTGEEWAADWYRRNMEFCRRSFVNGAVWPQATNRRGEVVQREGTNLYRRDNYHPPRGFMLTLMSLERMLGERPPAA